ncbi:heme exporter protein CcmD [Parvularcula sp. LCG005]|nr:heme exporter protein CcmD [Parvularcula sp. LCG005]WOI53673.1 heme exporter protein CcmD [Parvularcula sp. LCG005]
MSEPTIGAGIVTADPTLFIGLSWGLSALILGGLVLHAVLAARRVKR